LGSYTQATAQQLFSKKALIDIGFPTAELDDQAHDTPFVVKKITLPCIKTRLPLYVSISIWFDNFPNTLKLETLQAELIDGLAQYGKVLNLSIAPDPRVPHLAGSHAITSIVPNSASGKKGELIPRLPHLQRRAQQLCQSL